MEGVVFLIIAGFFFPIIGVIVLLVRTSRQKETLREYGGRIDSLEKHLRLFPPGVTAVEPAAPVADAAPEPPEPEPPHAVAADTPAFTETFPAPAETVMDAPAPAAPEPEPSHAAAADTPAFTETLPAPAEPGMEAPAPAARSAAGNALAAFIHGGNLWAAGGIILLLAGFAALITYLASRGFFTVEMGIAAAALSGLAMLASGWRFRKKRPVYFLLLQGGGVGVLYLSVFAAHKLTPWFPPLITLILMILLVIPAVILALFQGSQALALLGFLGGFAAPLLLASDEGNYVFLFAYYGVLDLGVLIIGFFRRWKGLNLLAFLCTFILANYWTAEFYESALFWRTEPFFLAYIIMFTTLGVYGSDGEKSGGLDLALILGTPGLGAIIQWKIFQSVPHGHALICLFFSIFYIFLALIIWKRLGAKPRIFSEAYLAFAVLLANLAVPLELTPRITGAVWAAEGLIIFFFGLRLDRFRILAAGLGFHLASAIAFGFDRNLPVSGEAAFRSPRFTGSLIIALSALVIVFFADHPPRTPSKIRSLYPAFPIAGAVWAFIWWFSGWAWAIYREPGTSAFADPNAVYFLFCSASALAAFGGAKILRCPAYRLGLIPSLAAGLLIPLAVFFSRISAYFTYRPGMILSHNFFTGLYLGGWLCFFSVQALLLFFSRRDLREDLHGLWLMLVICIGLGTLSSSGRALTLSGDLAPAWTSLAGLAPLFAAMIVISLFIRAQRGEASPPAPALRASAAPLSGGLGPPQRPPDLSASAAGFRKKLLFFVLPLMLSGIMGLWFVVTLFLSGDPSPLPFYIPVINPLDLEEAFCIVLFLLWQSALFKPNDLPRMKKPALFCIIDSMIFLFTIAVTARSVHFYGAVPYRRVFDSGAFQLCLFILWAVYGIGHIIGGSRRSLRQVWIAGAVLTVTDIAKFLILDLAETGAISRIVSFFIAGFLLLFIGWAAPLPPAEKKIIPPEAG
jgi:uncharacterized membrane protein